MAQPPRPSSPRSRTQRPKLDIPSNISDIVMQEFTAFGDVVAKLTDATVLLEYNRARTEFYLLIGPSAEEQDGATTTMPVEAPLPTPLPAPTPPLIPPVAPPKPNAPPTLFIPFLKCPGVRHDN